MCVVEPKTTLVSDEVSRMTLNVMRQKHRAMHEPTRQKHSIIG